MHNGTRDLARPLREEHAAPQKKGMSPYEGGLTIREMGKGEN